MAALIEGFDHRAGATDFLDQAEAGAELVQHAGREDDADVADAGWCMSVWYSDRGAPDLSGVGMFRANRADALN